MNNEKRAELHLHTKMSVDVSVIAPAEICTLARQKHLSAVAITDLNTVQSFPEVMRSQPQYGEDAPKIIYGAEVGCWTDGIDRPYRMTLLAKNQAGIKELYMVISSLSGLETDEYCPVMEIVDLSVLRQNRANLLCGSCGCYGELFRALLRGTEDAEVKRIATQYDYFELFPADSEQEKAIYAKKYAIGKKLGIPVLAVGNCCYANPEDAKAKTIVDGTPLPRLEEGDRHLRSPQDMADAFAYLGDTAVRELVFDAPERLAAMIEPVRPMAEGYHPVTLPDAYWHVARCCYAVAEDIYGIPLPQTVADRLETELAFIHKHDTASCFELVRRIRVFLQERGHGIGTRGSVGSSLVAFLLGITDCNPLPPHYICTHCRLTLFDPEKLTDGFDLPEKQCPRCQAPMHYDGHNIPCETFFGWGGGKQPDIDLNVPDSMQKEVLAFVRDLFGEERVAYAGTVSIISAMVARDMVRAAEAAQSRCWGGAKARYEALITGIRRGNGHHPGGVFVLPENKKFSDFTPIRHIKDPKHYIQQVTHMDFQSLHDTLVKADILGQRVLDMLRLLEEYTDISKEKVPLNDSKVYELFACADTLGVPEFNTDFMKDMLIKTKPSRFADLVQICGLSHGTGTWVDNGEEQLIAGHALSELPALRDDVFLQLVRHGVEKKTAFRIGEYVRRGKICQDSETTAEFTQRMREAGVPTWYIQSLRKIRYMSTKSHAVSYVINAVRLAWFKVHYPIVFYAAYLSCYFPIDNQMTEENKLQFQEVFDECSAKGIQLLEPDAEKSQSENYLPENGNIRMPYVK